jgi:hypothetical protein
MRGGGGGGGGGGRRRQQRRHVCIGTRDTTRPIVIPHPGIAVRTFFCEPTRNYSLRSLSSIANYNKTTETMTTYYELRL